MLDFVRRDYNDDWKLGNEMRSEKFVIVTLSL